MSKFYITVIILVVIVNSLFSLLEYDCCGKTIIVALEPEISHFNQTLVSDSFFGNFEKKSVENIK